MIILRKGISGPIVGSTHQLLIEAGYQVPQPELMAQVFGEGTFDAIRAFQASHVDQEGHPLTEDGVIGPATMYALQHPGTDDDLDARSFYADDWYYHPEDARELLRPVLAFACSKIGQHEDPDGSNDGPAVRAYTLPGFTGCPWCALFASRAYAELPGGSPFGRLAATWAIYDWAQQNGRLVGAGEPAEPGDLLLLLRGQRSDPQRRGHTTMAVTREAANGRIYTVGGNESNAVRGGLRMRMAVSAVVRPA